MLLDDELQPKEALELLKQIQNDSELESKWNRLNIASLALKSETKVLHQADFIDRVSRAIESEPVNLSQPQARNAFSANRPIVWALAASIAFMALIFYKFSPTRPVGPAEVVAVKPMATKPIVEMGVTTADINPVADLIFDDYLVTHNESSYSTRTVGFLPYARVVSYNRDK